MLDLKKNNFVNEETEAQGPSFPTTRAVWRCEDPLTSGPWRVIISKAVVQQNFSLGLEVKGLGQALLRPLCLWSSLLDYYLSLPTKLWNSESLFALMDLWICPLLKIRKKAVSGKDTGNEVHHDHSPNLWEASGPSAAGQLSDELPHSTQHSVISCQFTGKGPLCCHPKHLPTASANWHAAVCSLLPAYMQHQVPTKPKVKTNPSSLSLPCLRSLPPSSSASPNFQGVLVVT